MQTPFCTSKEFLSQPPRAIILTILIIHFNKYPGDNYAPKLGKHSIGQYSSEEELCFSIVFRVPTKVHWWGEENPLPWPRCVGWGWCGLLAWPHWAALVLQGLLCPPLAWLCVRGFPLGFEAPVPAGSREARRRERGAPHRGRGASAPA